MASASWPPELTAPSRFSQVSSLKKYSQETLIRCVMLPDILLPDGFPALALQLLLFSFRA